MRILFDHGTPVPLRRALADHDVSTTYERGWASLDNGALLKEAESQFDVLITTDKNLRYQQSLAGLRLAILILPTTSWPKLQTRIAQIRGAVDALRPGALVELE